MVSGKSFNSKKNLTKKHTLWIQDPEKFIPDPGGKRAPDPGSGILLLYNLIFLNSLTYS
jgi:hypothetical protein